MSPNCTAKHAIMRGMRPSTQQKSGVIVCRRRCIFCEIWKLATVVFTHVSISTRYSTTPEQLQRQSSENYDYAKAEKTIEAALNKERSRVLSIMSICTVEGAEQSDGLNLAYENCLNTVKKLLYQEAVLEEALIMTPTVDESHFPQSYRSRALRQQNYYHHSNAHQRPNMVSMAA